jgi:hypothetical protein
MHNFLETQGSPYREVTYSPLPLYTYLPSLKITMYLYSEDISPGIWGKGHLRASLSTYDIA